MFKADDNKRNFKVYKKNWEDKLKSANLKHVCNYYIIKDGRKIDTYDLSMNDLIFVAIANKDLDLSTIICEKQKITNYEKLYEFLKFKPSSQSKKQEKFFFKVIDQLGGSAKYQTALNIAESHNIPLLALVKTFAETKADSNDRELSIPCPPITGTKNVKIKILPENKENKEKTSKEKIF